MEIDERQHNKIMVRIICIHLKKFILYNTVTYTYICTYIKYMPGEKYLNCVNTLFNKLSLEAGSLKTMKGKFLVAFLECEVQKFNFESGRMKIVKGMLLQPFICANELSAGPRVPHQQSYHIIIHWHIDDSTEKECSNKKKKRSSSTNHF